MRTLARLLVALATMMALAMSLAIGFNEDAVDYSNQDMAKLYVSLSHTDQGLLVSLSETPMTGSVGYVDVDGKLTAYDNAWFSSFGNRYLEGDIVKYLGNHCWAMKAFPDLVTLKHVSINESNWFTTIRFTLAEPMRTVTAAYLARLGALGYTVAEVDSGTANIGIYMAQQGSESIRLVIVRNGDTTKVTLAPA